MLASNDRKDGDDSELLFPKPDSGHRDLAKRTTRRRDTYPILIRLDRCRHTGHFASPSPGGPRSREFSD